MTNNYYTIEDIADGSLTMDTIRTNGDKKLFNVVSLFAGGGGSSMGYKLAGANIMAINEFIPKAQEVYLSNFPGTHVFKEDVRELTGKMILDQIGLEKGELDVLDGSPPCSAFSMAGQREDGWGKEKKYSDTTQCDVQDLFLDYIRILDDLQPKVFIAENVQGLLFGSAEDYFLDFKYKMRKCGYKVHYKVMDASDFGVSQHRKRLFFVGVRTDIDDDFDDWGLGTTNSDIYPTPSTQNFYVKDAMKNLVVDDTTKPLNEGTMALDLWNKTEVGDSFEKASIEIKGKKSHFSHIRLSLDKISPTMIKRRSFYHCRRKDFLQIQKLDV